MRSVPFRPALVAAIALLLTAPATAPAAVSAETLDGVASLVAGATTDAEREAVRFRTTFGLQSDISRIRLAAADPVNYSDEMYGVPLSASELAEMARRSEVQARIDAAAEFASHDPTFGGMYLDQHDGGLPVFLFTSDVQKRASELASVVPVDVAFRVDVAARTYGQLVDLNDRIASSWDALKSEGVNIVSAGIKTDENTVIVGVQGLTPATAERLETQFGDGLRVREGSAAVADTCVSFDNCRPIKGGLKITRPTGYCTSGFVVKRTDNGEIDLLTAGHCIQVLGGLNAVWNHNGDAFGTAGQETWDINVTRDGDAGLIKIDSDEIPTTKNQGHTTGSTVKTVSGWDAAQYVGDVTCRAGATSDLDCGEIHAVDVTRDSVVTGVGTMHVRHTNEVSFDSTGGDSGGPEFFYSGSAVIAQGTHVHSDPDPGVHGWFTPISWGRTTFTTLFGYYFNVCMYASC